MGALSCLLLSAALNLPLPLSTYTSHVRRCAHTHAWKHTRTYTPSHSHRNKCADKTCTYTHVWSTRALHNSHLWVSKSIWPGSGYQSACPWGLTQICYCFPACRAFGLEHTSMTSQLETGAQAKFTTKSCSTGRKKNTHEHPHVCKHTNTHTHWERERQTQSTWCCLVFVAWVNLLSVFPLSVVFSCVDGQWIAPYNLRWTDCIFYPQLPSFHFHFNFLFAFPLFKSCLHSRIGCCG